MIAAWRLIVYVEISKTYYVHNKFSIFLVVGGFIVWMFDQAKKSNIGELIFENRLAIPELLEPTLDDQGRKVFDLTFTTGEVEFNTF